MFKCLVHKRLHTFYLGLLKKLGQKYKEQNANIVIVMLQTMEREKKSHIKQCIKCPDEIKIKYFESDTADGTAAKSIKKRKLTINITRLINYESRRVYHKYGLIIGKKQYQKSFFRLVFFIEKNVFFSPLHL